MSSMSVLKCNIWIKFKRYYFCEDVCLCAWRLDWFLNVHIIFFTILNHAYKMSCCNNFRGKQHRNIIIRVPLNKNLITELQYPSFYTLVFSGNVFIEMYSHICFNVSQGNLITYVPNTHSGKKCLRQLFLIRSTKFKKLNFQSVKL